MHVTHCTTPSGGAFFAPAAWSSWTFRGEMYRRRPDGRVERFVGGLWIRVTTDPAEIGRVALDPPVIFGVESAYGQESTAAPLFFSIREDRP